VGAYLRLLLVGVYLPLRFVRSSLSLEWVGCVKVASTTTALSNPLQYWHRNLKSKTRAPEENQRPAAQALAYFKTYHIYTYPNSGLPLGKITGSYKYIPPPLPPLVDEHRNRCEKLYKPSNQTTIRNNKNKKGIYRSLSLPALPSPREGERRKHKEQKAKRKKKKKQRNRNTLSTPLASTIPPPHPAPPPPPPGLFSRHL
jgi:hypothetical protein